MELKRSLWLARAEAGRPAQRPRRPGQGQQPRRRGEAGKPRTYSQTLVLPLSGTYRRCKRVVNCATCHCLRPASLFGINCTRAQAVSGMFLAFRAWGAVRVDGGRYFIACDTRPLTQQLCVCCRGGTGSDAESRSFPWVESSLQLLLAVLLWVSVRTPLSPVSLLCKLRDKRPISLRNVRQQLYVTVTSTWKAPTHRSSCPCSAASRASALRREGPQQHGFLLSLDSAPSLSLHPGSGGLSDSGWCEIINFLWERPAPESSLCWAD